MNQPEVETRDAAPIRQWWPVLVALALIAVLVWMPVARTWRSPVSPLDEGMSLTYPDLLLDGKIAGADFDTTIPPGTTTVVAAAFLVGGSRVASERAAGFVFDLVALVSVALILRPRGRNAVLIGTVAVAALYTTGGSALFPWATGSAALLATAAGVTTLSRCQTERWSHVWAVLAGVAAGFTVASRFDMGFAIAVLAVFTWIDLPAGRRWFAGGALVGAAPLLVQLVAAGPLLVFRKLVFEPAFVWGPYRRVPFSGLDGEIVWRFGVTTFAVMIVVAWGVYVARTMRGPERLIRVAVAALAIPALPYAWQRLDAAHASSALTLALVALLVAVTDVLRARGVSAAPSAVGGVLICAMLLLPTSIDNAIVESLEVPGGVKPAPAVVTGEQDRSVYVSERIAEPLQAISDELVARAESGDRLVVGVSEPRQVFLVDTYLYFLFPSLDPGTYYLEFNPGVMNAADSDYAADLRTADWVILNSAYDNVADADRQPLGPTEPIKVVDEQFCEVAVAGTYRLLERCR